MQATRTQSVFDRPAAEAEIKHLPARDQVVLRPG